MELNERNTKIKSISFGFSICPHCHDSLPYNKATENTRKCKYKGCGSGYFVNPSTGTNWMSVKEYTEKEYWKEGPFWSERKKDEPELEPLRVTHFDCAAIGDDYSWMPRHFKKEGTFIQCPKCKQHFKLRYPDDLRP